MLHVRSHSARVLCCTCGSLGELLVTCKTLRELVVPWCTCGSLGMLASKVVHVRVTCTLGGHVVHVRVACCACRTRGVREITGSTCSHVLHVQNTL